MMYPVYDTAVTLHLTIFTIAFIVSSLVIIGALSIAIDYIEDRKGRYNELHWGTRSGVKWQNVS